MGWIGRFRVLRLVDRRGSLLIRFDEDILPIRKRARLICEKSVYTNVESGGTELLGRTELVRVCAWVTRIMVIRRFLLHVHE